MAESLFKKTIETGAQAAAQVAHVGLEAARVKERVEHAVEDGVVAAKRVAKRGRYAAEDLVEDAAHCVKQNPFSAVAVSFWAGFGLGVLVIWLSSHNHKA